MRGLLGLLAGVLVCLGFGAIAREASGDSGGGQIWQQAGCGTCHTLAAAGSTAGIGPNLDRVRPSAATVALKVRYGSGVMPSYAGKLSDAQIQTLAAYVASVAGKTGGTSTTPAALRRAHSAADTALARRVLLVKRDLGSGWTSAASRKNPALLTCSTFTPDLGGVVETGAASTRVFAEASGGPFVSQASFVYATAAQATTLWRRVVGAGLLRCLADSAKSGGFTVIGKRTLGVPTLAARSVGYRVTAKGVTSGKTVTAYVDTLLIARGRTLTELSFTGYGQPVARQLELRLARIVGARLPQS